MDLSKPLAGKSALITGASRGIGRALALALAEAGADIVVNYHRDAASAGEVVTKAEQLGVRAIAIQADIQDLSAFPRLCDGAIGAFGGLDIAVLNATGEIGTIRMDDATPDDFERLFAANARAFFFAMCEAGKRLREGGRIISISSGGVVRPGPGAALYNGSKAALEYFTQVYARELPRERRITVNTIMPGVIRTDGLIADAPQAFLDRAAAEAPVGRLGEPDDLASALLFLCDERSSFVTAQRITVNGGLF